MWKLLAFSALALGLVGIGASSVNADDRALIIGINVYPEITKGNVAGARNLRGAVADAERFAGLAQSHFGFKKLAIKTLIDGQATKANIIAEFDDWLVKGTKPGDRVLFYFAGHGAQIADDNGDEGEDRFDEALAPADTKGELSSAPVKLSNLIIDDEIGEMMKKLSGRDVLVVIDACNSGTATRSLVQGEENDPSVRTRTLTPSVPALTRSLSDLTEKEHDALHIGTRLIDVVPDLKGGKDQGRIAVWTATESNQLALDLSSGGVFTQSFAAGIAANKADKSRDGRVSVTELLNFVKMTSKTQCEKRPLLCKSGLTPTLEADDKYFTEIIAPFGDVVMLPTKAKRAEAVFAKENDFDVSIKIDPGKNIDHGDEVSFTVTSKSSGHVLIFDEGPDGKFRQIFPNIHSQKQGKDGLIRANAPLTIPDATYGVSFVATDRGKGTLIVLVAEEDASLHKISGRNFSFEPLADVEKVLAAIAKRLSKPRLSKSVDQPHRSYRWSFATYEYEVK